MKKFIKIISLVLVLALAAAVFAACGKKDDDVPGDGPIEGGWSFSNKAVNDLTEDEKAVFDEAMKEFVGSDLAPKSVVATQVVSGMNYAFLCVSTPVVPNPQSHWSLVIVYKDLGGNVELMGIEDIDGANVKTLANTADELPGGWIVDEKDERFSISEAVDGALGRNLGVSLSPVAVLATQVVAGTNYRILARGTTVTATPVTSLYVVDVYASLDGSAEITSVNVFDLLSYINAATAK